eukprot:354101-Chlamydomonas_euryale.AAC.1
MCTPGILRVRRRTLLRTEQVDLLREEEEEEEDLTRGPSNRSHVTLRPILGLSAFLVGLTLAVCGRNAAPPQCAVQDKERCVLSGTHGAGARNLDIAGYKCGDIVEGTVEGLQTYGAFVRFEDGNVGLLHATQVSSKR